MYPDLCKLTGGPRHLPAFPTRRSSDLILRGALLELGVKVVNDTFFDTLLLETGTATPAIAVAAECERINLDRKSTRLNSSHVKISYAVFCLKKKNLSHLIMSHIV